MMMMRESNFDPTIPDDDEDLGFAFNDTKFSDRLLHVYISSDSLSPSAAVVKVKTFQVSSAILSARSPFFHKLFSNGMKESKQRYATLRITASEETGFMELLKFMYSNDLTVTSTHDVLDVLMAADKFDVASCMKYCGRVLSSQITPEFVLIYLGLPSNILMAEALQPLTVAAKQLYAVHYKDITRFEDEILRLPLADVEAIIASDDLQVTSEYAVYLFVLKWARSHYPKIEDRGEIMTRLAKFIRCPYMTCEELKEFLNCHDISPLFSIFAVQEAVLFKKNALSPDFIMNDEFHRFVEREAYKYRPVKKRVQVRFRWPWFLLKGLTWGMKGLTWFFCLHFFLHFFLPSTIGILSKTFVSIARF